MQRLLGIAVVVASGMLRLSANASTDDVVEGRIIAASKSSITVVDKQGENVLLLIGANCKITRDGKPSEAMMLGAGDRVRITAADEAGKLVAKTIDARSAEKPLSKTPQVAQHVR